jgi:hypothetical protein
MPITFGDPTLAAPADLKTQLFYNYKVFVCNRAQQYCITVVD